MDENILACLPLNEAVAFGGIKPLDDTFLSHNINSFDILVTHHALTQTSRGNLPQKSRSRSNAGEMDGTKAVTMNYARTRRHMQIKSRLRNPSQSIPFDRSNLR
jgi:hypothetical protein